MSRKQISEKTIKKLFGESMHCCFPDCKVKLYDKENDVVTAEMCHIVAVNNGGARYEANFPADKIDLYENLLLMCPTHHKIIDENPNEFTKVKLENLKKEHVLKYSQSSLTNEKESTVLPTQINYLSDQIIEKVVNSFITKENLPLPEKKKYPPVSNYISRKLSLVNKEQGISESFYIEDILQTQKKITILGIAGAGKTVELNRLANSYSASGKKLFPIKIRLNYITTENIEDILTIEYPNFKRIPSDQLLIILDALDEVHTDYLDVVTNKIILFSKRFEDSFIIVSCRNNFYTTENEQRNAKLEGFSTFLLKPLTYEDINQYIKENKIPDPHLFIEKLKEHKLYDLLLSPFYLVNLVGFYHSENKLPNSKREIFEYLINRRTQDDLEKYKNTGIRIGDFQLKVEEAIEKLAISSVCLGRNYLHEKNEFQKIITSDQLFQILRHTFLFNKNHTDKWEFEHNNFQEFLASKYLSKLDFESIKKFISFYPHFNKIKPNWLNTLSFLFSILNIESKTYSSLLEWIIEIEPDALIRFEKERIGLETRENIFLEIYESYERKGIVIRNEKFESEDLARFVSDSTKILEFLIDKAKNAKDDLKYREAISLFRYFNQKEVHKMDILEVLLSKLSDSDASKEIKYKCLTELAYLEVSDEKLTKQILSLLEINPNQYFRAGVYKYLIASDNFEDYCDLYIKGAEFIDKNLISGSSKKNNDVYLGDEKFSLEKIFNKLNKPSSIKKVLNWITSLDYLYKPFYFEISRLYLDKAAELYNSGDKSIYESVLNLLLSSSKKYQKDLKKDLREFFSKTNTSENAFKMVYNSCINEKDENLKCGFVLGMITEAQHVNFLVSEIKQKKLNENQIIILRNALNFYGDKEVFNEFYSHISSLKRGKYKLLPYVDYNTIRLSKRKKDIELLFQKKQFEAEVKKIYELEDAKELTEEELWDYKKAHLNDDLIDNDIVIETLRNRARSFGKVTVQDIIEMLDNPDQWKWFTLHKLISYDSEDEKFDFGNEEFMFIQNWICENISVANFSTAIQTREDGGYHYRYTELYIPYFAQRFDFSFTEEEYLAFLSVDCHFMPFKKPNDKETSSYDVHEEGFGIQRSISGFICEKIGYKKVIERIILNLKSGKLSPIVEFNHFILCKKYKITESADLIFDNILSDKFSLEQKKSLINCFIFLKGDPHKIISILSNIPDEIRFFTLDLLIKNSVNVEDYCKNEVNTITDENIKLRFIHLLLRSNAAKNLSYYKNWILINKMLPERSFDLRNLTLENLPDLIDIYECTLKYELGSVFWHDRSDYIGQIIELSSADELSYNLVKQKIEFWITEYSNTRFLYYQLQKLDQLYYSQKGQTLTIDEVLSRIV